MRLRRQQTSGVPLRWAFGVPLCLVASKNLNREVSDTFAQPGVWRPKDMMRGCVFSRVLWGLFRREL